MTPCTGLQVESCVHFQGPKIPVQQTTTLSGPPKAFTASSRGLHERFLVVLCPVQGGSVIPVTFEAYRHQELCISAQALTASRQDCKNCSKIFSVRCWKAPIFL
jgi:hypothetical protein